MILILLIQLVHWFFELLILLIFARFIVSWLPVDPHHQLVGLLRQVTDPLLRPFSFARTGMLDFSPLLAIILLQLADRIVVTGLVRLFH
ncbi:MAG: YggT family protein [Gracilibacteraceae bacterium]|nr:YggT family protein [Gracilibacteraceae bacterium]